MNNIFFTFMIKIIRVIQNPDGVGLKVLSHMNEFLGYQIQNHLVAKKLKSVQDDKLTGDGSLLGFYPVQIDSAGLFCAKIQA